jgi:hypothetical protein
MAKMSIPESPRLYATRYENLRGVDYSCDLTEVSAKRTPTGLNMISDNGGNPIKRVGWRVEADINCGKVFEIIFNEDDKSEYDPLKKYIIGETGIYAVVTKNGEQSVVCMLEREITSARHFLFNGNVFAFVNGGMYKFEGVELKDVVEEAYIPEVTISKNPDGTAGKSLEGVNLLTPARKVGFLGNETDKKYYFYPAETRADDRYKYVVADSIKAEILTLEGWQETTDFTKPTTTEVKAKDIFGNEKTFTVCEGYITFSAVHKPLTVGQDNVRITFESFDNTPSVEGDETSIKVGQYKEERLDLMSATACKTYGYSAVDRVFLVGGKLKNRVYYSDVNEPMYYPDINYLVVGHDKNGVVGLHRVSGYLAAVKEDSSIEGTVFLISGAYLNDDMYFKVTPTSAGTGAIAPKSFSTLIDEPLFLARDGVYAIANYYTTTEKVLRNRSRFLDRKLVEEPNLKDACSIVWNRYYLLAVNNHCYILDGRNKAQDKLNNTDHLYESYYWENIPAVVFYVHDGDLYFGTADGKLCRFNTDIENDTAYCDNGTLFISESGVKSMENGVVIPCEWSTPLDDDGRPQYFKTLNKKGTMLTLLPYERSSVEVTLIKDGGVPVYIGKFTADIHTWEMIDFARISFNSDDTAQDAFFKKKLKKYKRLRIVVKNNEIYEPFGILGLTKTYSVRNFSKNKGV